MTVLGIETSCDETAAAVVRVNENGEHEILSNAIYSQIHEHETYGGVVPEIAARSHIQVLDGIAQKAMDEAGTSWDDLSAVAATAGPGLIGGVIVGLMTAKAIAMAANKPLLAINHLEGHALTARLTDKVAFPYLLLLVSGGHTQFLLVKGIGEYERLGTTIDDAIGEAFDKTAKLLGLPYPGGPAVEQAAAKGDPKAYKLPRPLLDRPGLDMSFAGLKTAVRTAALKEEPVSDETINNLCAAFQEAVADVIGHRSQRAFELFKERFPEIAPVMVIAGGVAANNAIRTRLTEVASQNEASLIAPPHKLCTDNAAMIAWAGIERLRTKGLDQAATNGDGDDMEEVPRPRWPLDQLSESVFGSGRKGAKV
ncbi:MULTISPECIES: tRNA (adenosine(37)-N6)-threonylcarbamoyltransferase complex transferase subunit TsaD [Pseudovibrio]|uniref:tRNA (adenosine(37)-N6)-threonylcarbamoyltransferase complex transferase subunit TsaD n=1 Tax=Stappiaceae TaxID=2821832 RepID=UPI002364FC4A|nr:MULTISPECIES: tRNA (adenosine(37)-N6)-threonylcarbamoyltransferase complex transferase subunit TsaD [Pseudovibrio]MDD7911741.1 tRNA (adenosine(37)-N6)-threonylcarbamoyltransferase complex transferase subunit TsaD [Pseudovibrio exalbescens]MDX5594809.1 tRNA (adenosine(37)-N6)-threonylcarbamoyltransferase complex transferase subunit TsaD [Pseudovibrio sp. SPO723]